MNLAIKHRGPDDQGVFVEGPVGLGHLRLAILDLSPRGHQPMSYEHNGRKVWITFNGEVFNYQEIAEELKIKGYTFQSSCDTEVILAAYLEYGYDCARLFNGMFAFVIYDPQRGLLFGARDRFGKKPLKYYYQPGKEFIFSSELKAILAHSHVPRVIDKQAIDQFLTLQYVPQPHTGFQGIHKLPHSHYFVLDLRTKDLKIERYYDLDIVTKDEYTEGEWMAVIERELDRAVRLRLISDVPLGAFLSGGVDSSAVVAFMKKFTDKVKTFSIIFDEKDYDEAKYARIVSDQYHTQHTEFKVKSSDTIKYLEDLVIHFEEPYADSSQLPTFMLSQLTRKHVTVALSGDGGDEVFGGYDKHRRHAFFQRYGGVARAMKVFLPVVRWLRRWSVSSSLEKLEIFLATVDKDVAIRHYNYTSYFDEFTKHRMYRPEFAQAVAGQQNYFVKLLQGKDKAQEMDRMYYLDFNTYLVDDINVKVDMASMYHALEVRAPFLDYMLIDAVERMPWHLKTDALRGKKVLKKMLEKYLPREILYRKKHGFSIPIKHWLRDELKDYAQQLIFDPQGLVLQIFQREALEKLFKDHQRGADHASKIWALMALNIWHKKYFTTSEEGKV